MQCTMTPHQDDCTVLPTQACSGKFKNLIVFLFLINEMLKNNITPIYLFKFTQVAAEGRVRGGLAEGQEL